MPTTTTFTPTRPFTSTRPGAPSGRSGPDLAGARPRGRALLLGVILTAQLMVVLDTTIVNVALPHIQANLGFSASGLSWVINAYILTFGGLLLLGARTGDLVGRRRAFLAGIALFTLSSLLGGFAVSGTMLLASRALQGIGAALAAPSALSLLTTAFDDGPDRVRAIALYTTMSAAGGATGLVAGGLLTELVSWRWVMFVNVPIGLAVAVLGRRVLAETPRRHGRFDLMGAATSTLAMTSLVFALVEAGSAGWAAPATLVAFGAGFVLLGVFVHAERRADEPILPLRLLAHSTRTTANAARGLAYAGMYGMFFFLSQYFQDVQGFSPLRAGVAFLPMPASVFVASQLTSRVLTRRLPQKRLMLIGAAFATVGLLVATAVQPATPYWHVLVAIVLVGIGLGISFVSLTAASLTDVDPADAGAASGLVNVAQQLGAALGLAVLVTAFGMITRHASLGGRLASAAATARAHALLSHGVDDVLGLGALFALAAFVLIAALIRPARPAADDRAVASARVVGLSDSSDDAGDWLDATVAAEAC